VFSSNPAIPSHLETATAAATNTPSHLPCAPTRRRRSNLRVRSEPRATVHRHVFNRDHVHLISTWQSIQQTCPTSVSPFCHRLHPARASPQQTRSLSNHDQTRPNSIPRPSRSQLAKTRLPTGDQPDTSIDGSIRFRGTRSISGRETVSG
jgi:hypothetical protein